MNTHDQDGSAPAAEHARSGCSGTAPRTRGRARQAASPSASERRADLVRLAAELFARKGFQATTVREIADEAGILSGSLYHHFDSKESIVDEVLSSFFDGLLRRYRAAVAEGGDPRELLARLIHAAYASLKPHRAAITIVHNDGNHLRRLPRFGYLSAAEQEIQQVWTDVITDGQEAGAFRSDVDPELTYRMIRDTIWGSVHWYRPEGSLTTDDLARHFMAVLFGGIGPGERAAAASRPARRK